MTTSPYNKAVVTLALEAVNPHHIPPAYIQGDTIGHTDDIAQNYAGVSIDIAMAKLVCVRYGIAGAMIAVPVTENIRIPSWEEIADIQAANRRVESYLPSLEKMIDWRAIEVEAARIADGGRKVCANFIETMRATGVDVSDALQVLLVMKRVGSDAFERFFGAGSPNPKELSGRVPLLRTDLVSKTLDLREEVLATVRESLGVEVLQRRSIVVASTDVHHFALYLMRSVLEQAGADVTDIGVSRDPEDIAKVAIETDADAVLRDDPQRRRPFLRRTAEGGPDGKRLSRGGVHGRCAQRGHRGLSDAGRRQGRPVGSGYPDARGLSDIDRPAQ